jgi:PAS domain S-box-containing protein
MVEAQSFTIAEASPAPFVSDDGKSPRQVAAAPHQHWRFLVLGAIIVVNAAVAVWLCLDVTQVSRAMLTGGDAELLSRVARWRDVAVQAMAGAGLVLALVTFAAFRFTEQAWLKRFASAQREWESESSRLRLLFAEKKRSEEHLLTTRTGLNSQITALTHANQDLQDELNRRRRAERSLSAQRQQLEATKDVLQVHVQARAQELQKLQRQYELILNAAGEGICGVEPGGKITFVNPTAARLLGLEVSKMVGCAETEVFGVPAQNDTTTIQKSAEVKPSEVILKRADGSTFTAEFMRSQIRENDRVVGRVVLFKDITERKKSAEALEHKAAELARSNSELEQFAFVASHDLQEPLRKIRAFGDRLKTKCQSALPEEGADYLDRMQNASARMQTLINDLLTFSRVISRNEPFVDVDLNQITREVLGDLEVRIEKTGAQVEVGDLPTLEGDPTQMRQLLQNLIGNALKFHAPGANPKVQVRATTVEDVYAENDICRLTVQDNGIGFDEKYLDRIFAVFQRLHGRQEFEGTGIGLAVCRRIVDRHKGTITAKSKPGEGTTFVIDLPLPRRLRERQLFI